MEPYCHLKHGPKLHRYLCSSVTKLIFLQRTPYLKINDFNMSGKIRRGLRFQKNVMKSLARKILPVVHRRWYSPQVTMNRPTSKQFKDGSGSPHFFAATKPLATYVIWCGIVPISLDPTSSFLMFPPQTLTY